MLSMLVMTRLDIGQLQASDKRYRLAICYLAGGIGAVGGAGGSPTTPVVSLSSSNSKATRALSLARTVIV